VSHSDDETTEKGEDVTSGEFIESGAHVKERPGSTERNKLPMYIRVGQTLRTGAIDTYYEIFGRGEAVIAIPGDQCTLDTLRPMHVLSNDFQLILYDRRGHGRTGDTEDDWSYRDLAEDLKGLMDGLGIQRAHLIGHSGGADTALEFILAYPDRAHSVVLIGANYDNTWMDEELRADVEGATPENYIPEMEELNRSLSPDGPGHYEAVFYKLRRLWLEEPKISIERLREVNTPTLVLVGDYDMIALPHTIRLYDALPHAELCVMPNCGHEQFFERPDFVLPIIRDFLQRHNSDSG
jgi:pimeloyl-ACP methyl ester carboxylesterase